MVNVEKISVALTAEPAATVRQAVKSGDYASASEVHWDALRAWQLNRAAGHEFAGCAALGRRALQRPGRRPLDMAAIKREARVRSLAGGEPLG